MDSSILTELQAAAGDLFTAEELELIARPAPAPEPETMPPEQAPPVMQAAFVMALDQDTLLAELDAMVAPATAALDRLQEIARRRAQSWDDERQRAAAAWTPATRTDRRGVVWDFLPPDTSPQAGDEIDDNGVWQPRPNIGQTASRYDRAAFQRIEAQRALDHALRHHTPDALPCRAARMKLDAAWQAQREALVASDDPTTQERDRIDLWRKDHASEYAATRRSVRTAPNADLSRMNAEEKAAHVRERERLKKQRQRAAAHAAKAA